ncbi:hypothetical protein BHE74_00052524, partial [Ensete ventricosum]
LPNLIPATIANRQPYLPAPVTNRHCHPLPPCLPNRFCHSQALLYRNLDLLFFIAVGQSLPSSLTATVAPLCSACTSSLAASSSTTRHCLPLPPSQFPSPLVRP